MAVRIIDDGDYQAMYCSTTMESFGPVFYADENVTDFLNWLCIDPRLLNQKGLSEKVDEWRQILEEGPNDLRP